MNFKNFTDPRHVYEGFFETYFIRPFIHHYADFQGKESKKSCGFSYLAWLVLTLGVVGIMLGLVGLLGPEVGFMVLIAGGSIWIAGSIVPLLALAIRTTHGEPTSTGKDKKHPVLGVDILLGVISLLFFIFGMLMMTITMHSEELRGDPGTGDVDSTTLELDVVSEEPIFTYQDEVEQSTPTDSLHDLEEPEAIAPDESFDPTLNTPDAIVSDSL